MPLPKGSEKANLQHLMKLLQQHTDQQKLLESWKAGGNKHQLAICFEFPPGIKIDFSAGENQSSKYAERVLRLCESVNQPDTIKADIWTRTPNNGTLAGVQPGFEVLGTPLTPELFLSEIGYVLIAFVVPGSKLKSGFWTVFAEVEGGKPIGDLSALPLTVHHAKKKPVVKKAVKKTPPPKAIFTPAETAWEDLEDDADDY